MGMQGQLQSVGKYTFSPRSYAPNLTGGRAVTAGMKLTTGIGEPDDGALRSRWRATPRRRRHADVRAARHEGRQARRGERRRTCWPGAGVRRVS